LLLFSGFCRPPCWHRPRRRIALLIGNQDYADAVGPLQNPHKDIARVGRALTDVGFNVLDPLKDATRDDMLFGVHNLAVKLRQAGAGAIGFLYYTGHGVSVGVDNVLVPKNARNSSDAELVVRGVKLSEILDILKGVAPDAVNFVVLDACRNNIRGKKGAKGFVAVSDYRMGVVLAFATAAGETASDEGTTSGPYAAALAEEIVKPGHNDQMVFNAVRARVVAATRGQTPWTHDGLVGERIVFKAAAAEIVQRPTPSGAMEVVRICREVEAMTSLSMLAVLERQHAGTPAADCISARIGELKAAAAKEAEERAKAEAAARKRAEDEARAKPEAERQRSAMLEQQRREAAEAEAARRRSEAASAMDFGDFFADFFIRRNIGFVLASLTDELRKKLGLGNDVKGVLVLEVPAAAAEKGVKPGDVIMEVNQDPVTSIQDVDEGIRKLKKAGRKSVLLRLESGKGGLRFVAVPVD
jgi:uncharacterized caspase-like protein